MGRINKGLVEVQGFNARGAFDFERLVVFEKALGFYQLVVSLKLSSDVTDRLLKKQLYRAAMSIVLNIAEGTGRKGLKDRKHFYTIARGSVFECAAILRILDISHPSESSTIDQAYPLSVEIAKILSTLIRRLEQKQTP